jgi:hypothetical protein
MGDLEAARALSEAIAMLLGTPSPFAVGAG